MKLRKILPLLLSITIILAGCGASAGTSSTTTKSETSNGTSAETALDTSDMFTERDMEVGYDESSSVTITLSGNTASSDSDSVTVDGSTVTITDEGTYILTGSLTDGMIIVDAEDTDKVQLVLNDVNITNADSAAIYILQADKVFVTTAAGTTNTLTNGGEYVAIDDNTIDSVIFSKDDLTLNGEGTLIIEANAGHGIVSKDDLVLTNGTYEIHSERHGLSGKDSVRINGGTYTITSGKDAIHASNSDDTSLGFVYIAGGIFDITAADDGIHADSALVIEGGEINISESYEGLEGLSIDITGGAISLTASDDGLNAAGGNDSSGTGGMKDDIFAITEGAYIHISGGSLHINASGDGIDSNGDLTVSGGETYVSGPIDGANGALDYNGEATISGGIFIAAGSSGMAQNFGTSSTQGVMMVAASGNADSPITLTDSDENELISWQADKSYSSVIISTPEITEGSTYTLTTDGTSTDITMDSLVYGSGDSMSSSINGGRMHNGDMKDRNFGKRPNEDSKNGNTSDENMPTPPSDDSNGTPPEKPETIH